MANQIDQTKIRIYVSNISFRNKFYFIFIFMTTWILFLTVATYVMRSEWLDSFSNRYSATYYQAPLTSLVNKIAIYKVHFNQPDVKEYELKLSANGIDEQIAKLTHLIEIKWYDFFSPPSWFNKGTLDSIQQIIDQWTIIKEGHLNKEDKNTLLSSMLKNCLNIIDKINIASSLGFSDNFTLLRVSSMVNVKIPQISNTLDIINQELKNITSQPFEAKKQIEFQMGTIRDTFVNAYIDRRVFAHIDEQLLSENGHVSLLEEFNSVLSKLDEFAAVLKEAQKSDPGVKSIDLQNSILNSLKSNDRFNQIVYPFLIKEYRRLRNSELFGIISILFINIFLILLVLIVWPSRSMLKPINALIDGTRSLLEGNYAVRVESKGKNEITEIADIFNQIAESLGSSFSQFHKASETFSQEGPFIAEQIATLRLNVIDETDQIKEISSRLKIVLSEVLTISGILDDVNESIKITTAHSNKGEPLLEDATENLVQIQQIANEVLLKLHQFQGQVSETNQIIDTIIKIVDQANLLYLNSSIHANKSGEVGRGFSIISDKIHELANISAYFTLDIEKAVNGLIPQLNEVSSLIERFSLEGDNQKDEAKFVKNQIQLFITNTKKQIELYNELLKETSNQASLMSHIHHLASAQSKRVLDVRSDIRNLVKSADPLARSANEFGLGLKNM